MMVKKSLGKMTTSLVVFVMVFVASSFVRGVSASCAGLTRRRRAWRDTSCADRAEYLQAVKDLKLLPQSNIYNIPNFDDFVRVHYTNRQWAHGVDAFLPWHRWYIYKFEEALQKVSGNDCLTLPYWDWEYDAGQEDSTSVLQSNTFGSSSGTKKGGPPSEKDCVTEGIVSYTDIWTTTVRTGGCLKRAFNSNFGFASDVDLLFRITSYDVYGPSSFRGILEGFPHANPHNRIGEHMSTMYSPDDPLFMMHHGNVDRIWAIWQDFRDHDTATSGSLTTDHYTSDLDAVMPYANAGIYPEFFERFGSGSGNPTPRDLHYSNGGLVDVVYVNDDLARKLLDSTAGDAVDYANSHNSNWIEIATSAVTTIDCSGATPTPTDVPTPVPTPAPAGTPTPVPTPEPTPAPGGTCTAPTNACTTDGECCSMNCAGNGVCRGNRARHLLGNLRSLQPRGPPDFSSQTAQARWDELIANGVGPANALKQIAKEECQRRGNPVGAPPEWIAMQGMEDQAEVFECYPLED